MDGSPWLIVIIIVLICLSAIFSASEAALISMNKIRMRQMSEKGEKRADLVLKLTENSSKLLSSLLVGNNLVNILSSSLATSVAIAISPSKGVAIATVAMTVIVLIFGEILPKTYATNNSEKLSLKVAAFISFIMVIFTPAVCVLNGITGGILKLFGGEKKEEPS
ncbi:MAG: DUF21 domain-containing protein, partial [Firmicutes bacterium]|nr:DUF21 domain-containing protein [Bacillota bacterium]